MNENASEVNPDDEEDLLTIVERRIQEIELGKVELVDADSHYDELREKIAAKERVEMGTTDTAGNVRDTLVGGMLVWGVYDAGDMLRVCMQRSDAESVASDAVKAALAFTAEYLDDIPNMTAEIRERRLDAARRSIEIFPFLISCPCPVGSPHSCVSDSGDLSVNDVRPFLKGAATTPQGE